VDVNKKLFDINSEEIFFEIIKNSFIKYKTEKDKSIELLLFIIMGLNHLREWIAPGYAPFTHNGNINVPKTRYEQFSNDVYITHEYKIVRKICNKSKHLKCSSTLSNHTLSSDESPNVDEVGNCDNGLIASYMVDDRDITEIIEKLILIYQTGWFNLNYRKKTENLRAEFHETAMRK
jgi:hypothetical protein